MRVAQRSMYNSFVSNMNRTLANYMESNIQSSTQKKVNRPSDDPVGMARVLNYRAAIVRNEQYESNTNDAAAWLRSTDSAMTQAQVILSSLQEKAEELATGTLTSENRKQASYEIRQLFEQLVNIANTQYGDEHLFAGHKTGTTPYEIGLAVTATNTTVDPAEPNADLQPVWEVSGSAKSTVMVRFATGGKLGTDAVDYEYSSDGGETWITKTLPAGGTELDLDGVVVEVPQEPQITVEAYDPDEPVGRENGSMLFIREAAYYKGDDNDPEPKVDSYGSSVIAATSAQGTFDKDVRIRLDEDAFANTDGTVQFSYSTDNGITWQTGTATTHAGDGKIRFNVPGGYLDVTPGATGTLMEGQQFVVRPQRANQGLEIAEGEFLTVTNAGKDIFGGLYTPPDGRGPVAAMDGSAKNIFETVSEFLVWAETGVQSGSQEALENLKTASEGLLTSLAAVGGKEQRAELNLNILENSRYDMEDRMSTIEDVDLTELVTKLAQQQMAYQSVLQSSTMIMQLNIMDYL